jgi:uncharacterized protein YlxP (DUF503 family)
MTYALYFSLGLALGVVICNLIVEHEYKRMRAIIEDLNQKVKDQRENVLIHDRNVEKLEQGFTINVAAVQCRTCKVQEQLDTMANFNVAEIPRFVKLTEVLQKMFEEHPYYIQQVLPEYIKGPLESVFTVLKMLKKQ